ncbi:MAG: hypothetical protein HY459_04340 [Parcubacteria group bacterium]|nr:hypothetical protein [Parcubacteria group bacterium]
MQSIVSHGIRTLSVHKEHEFLGRLEAAGLSSSEAQTVIESKDNDLAERLVAFIRNGGVTPVSYRRAREIMGLNMIGTEEAVRYLAVPYSRDELTRLGDIPFTETKLLQCKDSHVLIAVYPYSVRDLYVRERNLFSGVVPTSWDLPFLEEARGNLRWYLFRKEVIPTTIGKACHEQLAELTTFERTPRTCEIVYLMLLYYLANGIRLFGDVDARCRDVSRGGGHAVVGFPKEGISLQVWRDDGFTKLGMAALE